MKRAQLAVAAWIFFYRLVPETKGKKSVNKLKSTGEQASIPRQMR